MKFDHTGRLACLEEAIDAGRRAAALASGDPTTLSNLAKALNELFDRTGQRSAADEALSMLRRAAAAVPPAHPNAAAVFSNISVTMAGLAGRLGEMTLADEALDFARRAAEAAPPGHHGRAAALNNLGSQLTNRFSPPWTGRRPAGSDCRPDRGGPYRGPGGPGWPGALLLQPGPSRQARSAKKAATRPCGRRLSG